MVEIEYIKLHNVVLIYVKECELFLKTSMSKYTYQSLYINKYVSKIKTVKNMFFFHCVHTGLLNIDWCKTILSMTGTHYFFSKWRLYHGNDIYIPFLPQMGWVMRRFSGGVYAIFYFCTISIIDLCPVLWNTSIYFFFCPVTWSMDMQLILLLISESEKSLVWKRKAKQEYLRGGWYP